MGFNGRAPLRLQDEWDKSYLPMQKVRIRPDINVYAGFSDLAFSWRLAGDLNSDGNFMLTSTEPTRMHRSAVSSIIVFEPS